jgi:hypothetical protein
MNDTTLLLIVFGATWGAMFQVMKIVEMQNSKRDLILDIDEKGVRLTPEQKNLLLWSDFFPVWLGLILFLLFFSGGFAAFPTVLREKAVTVTTLESMTCYGAATFAAFATLVEIIAGFIEMKRMREFINTKKQ